MAPRLLTFLVLCAMSLFIVHREKTRTSGKIFDDIHMGWLHANSHVENRTSRVLLIALDDGDKSRAERIFQSWPLSELDYALLFDNLFQNSPRAVAIEPVLSWPADGAPFIESLASRLKVAPPMVLGTLAEFSELSTGRTSENSTENPLTQDAPLTAAVNRHMQIESVVGNREKIPSITQFIGVPAQQVAGQATLAVSHIDLGDNIETPGDGTLRVPLLARVGDKVIATFPLAALLLHREIAADQLNIELGHRIIGPDLIIDVDETGRFSLDIESLQNLPTINARLFALSISTSPSSADTSDSADSVISDLIESDADYGKVELLKTHLAVVGQNDRGAHRFATGEDDASLSRAEVFCQTIAAMDVGQQLIKAPQWSDYAIAAGMLVLMISLLRRRRSTIFKSTILSALLLAMASLLAFQQWHLWFPIFSGLVVIGCASLAAMLVPIHDRSLE